MTNQDHHNMSHIYGHMPADLLKFIAYKGVANSFEDAVRLIKGKKLVLGEPIAVPFKYIEYTYDGSTGVVIPGAEKEYLAFGIGTRDIDNPYISCSIFNNSENDILNAPVPEKDDDGNTVYVSLGDYLERWYVTKEHLTETVVEIVTDPSTGIIEKIVDSSVLSEAIKEKSEEYIVEHLTWKKFPPLE